MSLNEKKNINTLQDHWVVHFRQHFLAIVLLRTTAAFIKDNLVYFESVVLIKEMYCSK